MDSQFRGIYALIYETRTTGDFPEGPEAYEYTLGRPLSARQLVREAIEEAERKVGRRLREDAKALLAINFHDLVVLPLRIAERVDLGTLREDVRLDVEMLVRGAGDDPGGISAENEVSGHAIIDALSRNWGELRISRFRLWER